MPLTLELFGFLRAAPMLVNPYWSLCSTTRRAEGPKTALDKSVILCYTCIWIHPIHVSGVPQSPYSFELCGRSFFTPLAHAFN